MKTLGRGRYTIERNGDRLIMRTGFFATGHESVLHAGIYNQEFVSALTAAAAAGMVWFGLATLSGNSVFLPVLFIVLSVAGYPVFRSLVFRDRYLETVFDPRAGSAEMTLSGMRRRVVARFPLSAITGIMIDTKTDHVENPDGVDFVKKISAQHGSVIPGFGEERRLFMLTLRCSDGHDRIIYTDSLMQEVLAAHEEIKGFLKL